MKRTAHSLIAMTAVAALAACTGANENPDEPGPDATESELSSTRFQTLWIETTELLDTLPAAGEPTNADEANEAAGLTEEAPLRYADLSSAPNGGKWCMESDDETYVAMVYGDGESTIYMGDDECTYAPASAVVVGDFMTATWIQGGNLMGDVTASPDA